MEKKHLEVFYKLSIVPLVLIVFAFYFSGCGRAPIKSPIKPPLKTSLPSIHYTIQVGAFSNIQNAVQFTEKLRKKRVNAYHFLHPAGLYKVRFGNFPSRTAANRRAKALLSAEIISSFYIVKIENFSKADLRDNIKRTAENFIGVPYRWGGESVEKGFDCSGFTMTVYKLNGLDLPRTSQAQWKAGVSSNQNRPQKGDLVFFHTSRKRKISHVGIYVGNDHFIHAPGKGDEVQRASLKNQYFKKNYTGTKTYF